MRINNARYVISAVKKEQYPCHHLPEFAMVGKSNVGKSSFINSVTNRKKLAYTSSQPGKTRTINFYSIDDKFYLVDLPGYGFARVSGREKSRWATMVNEYLTLRDNLRLIIHLLDIRHPPTRDDLTMYEYITYYNLNHIIVATKVDKISRSKAKANLDTIKKHLQVSDGILIIPYSSQNGQGREKILEIFQQNYNNLHLREK